MTGPVSTVPNDSSFRRRLAAGEPVLGVFNCLPAFQVSEILSHSSMDYIVIEAEHGATALPAMHAQVAAIAERKPVVVRVASDEPGVIKPILDLGVTGIMVPDVRSADAARDIVRQTRFAPEGTRGIGGSIRASRYGMDKGYFRDGPAEPITVILQIESREGLDNIAEIAAVDGVDAVFFGPMDLSAQLGHRGRPDAPEVAQAMDVAIRQLAGTACVAGCLCPPAKVGHWRDRGISLFLLGSDIGALTASVEAMASSVTRPDKEDAA
ncbi:4-hydroxy-2-oxoheptanedioate aldolase [Mameliella alba]|uniref:HpcH/HpaI aldolase family protein n=1 Tax=Mameliella alba TaxID=561184 RepID=UPI0008861D97|nr:aldolase/citrate lyase family protein [Mameliella alba]OWV42731.1 4-hydroxy-2-oxo-heptane-1,7-dioate aldolase [Mameliella alba]PTR35901.1 4-hydroxy-2-oxoheptanedioate aldolase [Mameliella alba]GGF82632.1 5-keto-4-deoxy-D-glucarate aldolase [Mameliella alba]SDE07452.1 4-hydroxy-2-oxoheptanedioate aldolase [Mameliella alba]